MRARVRSAVLNHVHYTGGIAVDELKKKLEELGRAFEQFKEANDQRINEVKKTGAASALVEEKVNKANADLDRLSAQVEQIKTSLNRPGVAGGEDKAKAEVEAKRQAFISYLRKGDRIGAEEMKLLSTDHDPNGGYLVSPMLGAEVIKKVYESSPIRQLASVQSISTDVLELLTDRDEVGSGWVGESESRSATDHADWGKISIVAHELYAKPQATQRFLDDASINIESWLSGKVAEKFARDEATAFVTGNGIKKPRGFASYASGTSWGQIQQVVSGHGTLLTADGLFDLQGALKEAYQMNAVWLMLRATVTAIRKLKDGLGNYIWQPGLKESAPDLILGKPVYHAADMAAVGAGTLPVAYGDFKAGYQIVDRVGIRTLRDPYSAKPYVEFYTTKRVGGDVKDFDAIKLQVVSA